MGDVALTNICRGTKYLQWFCTVSKINVLRLFSSEFLNSMRLQPHVLIKKKKSVIQGAIFYETV